MTTRFKEHLNVRKPTAVTDHLLRNKHNATMENIHFSLKTKNDRELLIKESLLVKRIKPTLNENVLLSDLIIILILKPIIFCNEFLITDF